MSLNKAYTPHGKSQRCQTYSAKKKVNIPKTERQMYVCHEPYLQIFTHNLALSGSSWLLSRYPLPMLGLRLCSAVQLDISLWPRELNKPPWSQSWRRLLYSSETLPVERVERLIFSKTGGNNCKGISHWPYFYAILRRWDEFLNLVLDGRDQMPRQARCSISRWRNNSS